MWFPGTPRPKPGGQFKRPGLFMPRGRARGATRLLLFNDAENHARPRDLYQGIAFPSTGAFSQWSASPYGWGAVFSGTSAISGPASAPTRCSLEALIFLDSISAAIACINEGAGASGTYDRMLYINSAGAPVFYIFDGAAKSATGSALSTGFLYHLVGTSDGSNIRLYVNGKLVATTAAGNAFTGFTSPYLYIGFHTTPAAGGSGTSTHVLLVQYASVCWSDAEVMGRFANPYRDVYVPGEDWMSSFVRGGVAGSSSGLLQTAVSMM